jgi:hypothetical protein
MKLKTLLPVLMDWAVALMIFGAVWGGCIGLTDLFGMVGMAKYVHLLNDRSSMRMVGVFTDKCLGVEFGLILGGLPYFFLKALSLSPAELSAQLWGRRPPK